VLVDGAVVGKAPLSGEVFVEPGKWTIEARLDGYTTARTTVEMAAGSSREVPVQLVKSDRADGVGPLNGERGPSASTPETRPETKKREDGHGGPRKEILIAGIAASALGIGAGIGFTAASNGHASDAEEQRQRFHQRGVLDPCLMPGHETECNEHADALAARDKLGNFALWSFVVGGALGMGAGAYVLATWNAKPVASVRAMPVVTAHGGGLVMLGSW
jgi:hypothetical protein